MKVLCKTNRLHKIKIQYTTGKQGNTQTTAGKYQASDQRKEKVCYYYKNNKCKYGVRGRDCLYAHPRLCTRRYWKARDVAALVSY